MKTIIALSMLALSILSFAENRSTEIVNFTAISADEATESMLAFAEDVHGSASVVIRHSRCQLPKVLSGAPAKLSYRANAQGVLIPTYTATLKISCQGSSND